MEEEEENLELSDVGNGSPRSKNNGEKKQTKFLLKGVSTEFSQH